jgi:hypothetical protein
MRSHRSGLLRWGVYLTLSYTEEVIGAVSLVCHSRQKKMNE